MDSIHGCSQPPELCEIEGLLPVGRPLSPNSYIATVRFLIGKNINITIVYSCLKFVVDCLSHKTSLYRSTTCMTQYLAPCSLETVSAWQHCSATSLQGSSQQFDQGCSCKLHPDQQPLPVSFVIVDTAQHLYKKKEGINMP